MDKDVALVDPDRASVVGGRALVVISEERVRIGEAVLDKGD